MFKDTMESIGQPCVPSKVVNDADSALEFAKEIGYPVIVRPAFTLGGTGGGIASDPEELHEIASTGLGLSPINQVLIEKSIAGWKEIEFEVIRDKAGNKITVCSMENFDPVGVHTGDSIVIAPAVTLSDKEYQMLRTAALNIIDALGVEGGCNCQFALNPDSFDYAVIEVNPRVSRSSALASKATGYPIAKVATKIALGYRLDEIKNAVTGNTYASFEPALDYVAVKGEVMSIADSFEEALIKAVRGAEIKADCLLDKRFISLTAEEALEGLSKPTDNRLFYIAAAMGQGVTAKQIHDITLIDMWFLSKVERLVNFETNILWQRRTDIPTIPFRALPEKKSLPTIRSLPYTGWSIPAQVSLPHRHLTSTVHIILLPKAARTRPTTDLPMRPARP